MYVCHISPSNREVPSPHARPVQYVLTMCFRPVAAPRVLHPLHVLSFASKSFGTAMQMRRQIAQSDLISHDEWARHHIIPPPARIACVGSNRLKTNGSRVIGNRLEIASHLLPDAPPKKKKCLLICRHIWRRCRVGSFVPWGTAWR